MKYAKGTDKALAKEIQRIDSLMAKWGFLLGFKEFRARRRELALILAEEYGEEVTDGVFKALMDEGRLQGVQKVHAWALGILEDRNDRKEYLPELFKASQGKKSSVRGPGQREPGDKMVQPGTREYLEHKASIYGTTLKEETFRARRFRMFSRVWGDRWSLEQTAEEQGIPVEQCRKEVSDEMESQWDRLPTEEEMALEAAERSVEVKEYKESLIRRFELQTTNWDSVLSFKKCEEIAKICKEKGYPNPLRRVTLGDWEGMQARTHARAKGRTRHKPPREPKPKTRAEIIADLDESSSQR